MTKRVYTQTFGVVGAVIEQDGKILLVREADRKGPDAGKWSQPAGWFEVGEDPLEAVAREVEEETGHAFTPTRFVGVYSLVRREPEILEHFDETLHAVKLIFTGTISDEPSGELAGDIAETRWFLPEEIDKMDHMTLRDADIPRIVARVLSGEVYPLDVVEHLVSEGRRVQ